jgi:NAD(P)H-hydrate epimerase
LLDAEAACRLAVFLHGAAGDLAEAAEGQAAMTATDVIACLGEALRRLVSPPKAE